MNPHKMISKVIEIFRWRSLQVSAKVPEPLWSFRQSLPGLREEFQLPEKKNRLRFPCSSSTASSLSRSSPPGAHRHAAHQVLRLLSAFITSPNGSGPSALRLPARPSPPLPGPVCGQQDEPPPSASSSPGAGRLGRALRSPPGGRGRCRRSPPAPPGHPSSCSSSSSPSSSQPRSRWPRLGAPRSAAGERRRGAGRGPGAPGGAPRQRAEPWGRARSNTSRQAQSPPSKD